MRKYIFILIAIVFTACGTEIKQTEPTLFELLNGKEVGIEFTNTVKNAPDFNIFSYRNFYNGGGVAIGDINNDGLSDVFMTSNMGSNKLFLNKGNWQFEDISVKAGIGEIEKWSTGVVMVDLNDDGIFDSLGVTGDFFHRFSDTGTYTIRIKGVYPRLRFSYDFVGVWNTNSKFIALDQWGDNNWQNLDSTFYGCLTMVYHAVSL